MEGIDLTQKLVLSEGFAFFGVLMRIIGTFIIMPGVAQKMVFGRYRLLLAIVFTMMVFPLLDSHHNLYIAQNFVSMGFFVVREIFVGFFIGGIARLIIATLDFAGALISFPMSLSNGLMMNPGSDAQGSIISIFLSMAGLALFFVLDLHHLIFKGILHSYTLIPADAPLPLGDMSESILKVISQLFYIGLQFATPVLLIGLIVQISAGILNRLMPQMPIFFVIMPATIWIGFTVFGVIIAGILVVFPEFFSQLFIDTLMMPQN